MNTLFNQLLKREVPYNRKHVIYLLLIVKHSNSERKQEKAIEELYFALSRITLKAINNFYFYLKNNSCSEERILHTRDDLASEFFIVLKTCMKKFNLKYKNSFHFYYNTAINRRIKRIFELDYRKHLKVVSRNDRNNHVFENISFSQNISFEEIDFQGFNQIEKNLIESKIKKEKISDFVFREHITNKQYNEYMNVVKTKLINLYPEEYALMVNR